ncbi:LysR family transcriptional regulator [Pleomorphomonas sp. PLEO]|uniref:LysR family transcriptional regulator n=1 Tax=Pleomorphomonas sp. PLEO TaxID=3239306 RepID=UPI00351E7E44
MMAMRLLDPEAVEAFLLVAELQSFTRAAGLLNTTQAAVSLRLRRLEDLLGQRLLERTPRHVRLTAAGERFVGPAREFVSAGRRAAEAFAEGPSRLAIGITHHLVGPDLPRLLRVVSEREAGVTLHLRTAGTRALLDLYDAGALDAVIVLRHDESRRGGEVLLTESFGWFAAPDFASPLGAPVPLAIQPEPCSLRAMALRALAAAGIPWQEAFVGTGATAVGAAAEAGLAVALLAHRAAPNGVVDMGDKLGLPPLPQRDAVMHSNVTGARAASALSRIAGAFRAMPG